MKEHLLVGLLRGILQSVEQRKEFVYHHRTEWNAQKQIVSSLNDDWSGSDSDSEFHHEILSLDVGGTLVETLQKKTMCNERSQDSMLGVWLGGEWGWKMDREEEDGLIFIDRDGTTFQQGGILDWLREGTDHLLFKSGAEFLVSRGQDWISTLYRESIYFSLTTLTTWCERIMSEMSLTTSMTEMFDCFPSWVITEPWFPTAGTPLPTNPPGFVDAVSLRYKQLARDGTFSYSLKLSTTTKFWRFGLQCKCALTIDKQSLKGHNVYTYHGDCKWVFACQLDWKDIKEWEEGDVVCCHLGRHQLTGDQSIWFTFNGKEVERAGRKRIRKVVDWMGVRPNRKRALVPCIRWNGTTTCNHWV
eukprot:TRINITY_DN66656_c5_g2_i1.p1 TRINITY_DN66656_c5_g2~~TRINITY_DN66656_c5_g2_i1.p1  ORF type:complete len:359 (-),score=0.38 TRINITY_DN66656_c5_g2_i1:354-1430(-)